MKISIISNLYPPYARGGAEQVVHKIVEELVRLGHQIVLITLTPGKDEKEVVGNVTIYRIHPRNIFFYTDAHHHNFVMRMLWHVLDIFNFDSKTKIQKILQEERPDMAHTHNLMGLGFLIPGLLRTLHIPHVHSIHDVQLVEASGIILKSRENSWRYHGLPTRLYTSIMKRLLGSPNVVISPSQFLLQFYEARGFFSASKRIVMRNPITLPSTVPATKKSSLFTFLYVGQIEEHKGIQFLIQSFLEFLPQHPDCELHIGGSGSSLEFLKNLAAHERKIIFHGKVVREKLPELFASADITIVPSLCYENSPTVIFESFSFGVPVLASDIEGIAELIHEGENGLTFISGSKGSLQRKLEWCFEHRAELELMGQKGKQALVDSSKENYTEKLIHIYTGK